MAEPRTSWARQGAWDGIAKPGRFGAAGEGLTITPLDNCGMASLLGPVEGAVAGLSAPEPGRASLSASHALVWSGPEHHLLLARDGAGFPALLGELGSRMAVSDQSDAKAVLRLEGPAVQRVLAKGVMLDLYPSAFPVGAAATSVVAHIGVQLWRLEDGADGAPVFEIAVMRSMARSFWSWLSSSAAEFGGTVATRG